MPVGESAASTPVDVHLQMCKVSQTGDILGQLADALPPNAMCTQATFEQCTDDNTVGDRDGKPAAAAGPDTGVECTPTPFVGESPVPVRVAGTPYLPLLHPFDSLTFDRCDLATLAMCVRTSVTVGGNCLSSLPLLLPAEDPSPDSKCGDSDASGRRLTLRDLCLDGVASSQGLAPLLAQPHTTIRLIMCYGTWILPPTGLQTAHLVLQPQEPWHPVGQSTPLRIAGGVSCTAIDLEASTTATPPDLSAMEVGRAVDPSAVTFCMWNPTCVVGMPSLCPGTRGIVRFRNAPPGSRIPEEWGGWTLP